MCYYDVVDAKEAWRPVCASGFTLALLRVGSLCILCVRECKEERGDSAEHGDMSVGGSRKSMRGV